MYRSKVTEIVQYNDEIRVAFDVVRGEGKKEEVVAHIWQGFPADIATKDLEQELAKVAAQHESDAKQAEIQAVNEAKTKNVDDLRQHFLGETNDV